MKKVIDWLKDSAMIDLRSLALFRIAFGSVMFSDLFFRLLDVEVFYTDKGFLTREYFVKHMANSWNYSFHLFTGETTTMTLLFVFGLICCALFIMGHRTRLITLLLWLFFSSMHNRNWMINSSGDDLFRLFLFIGFFLPLSKRYSMDSALVESEEKSENTQFFTWNYILFAQLFAVYFVSYFFKDHPRWRETYTAVFYSLQLENFSTELGFWLSQFTGLTKFFTFFSINLELFGPILIFISLFTGKYSLKLRGAVATIFIFFHMGLIFTLKIGTFPYVLIAVWLALLPNCMWDWIESKFKTQKRKSLQIYYDGDCGFCRKLVLIIKGFFLIGETTVAKSQEYDEVHQYLLENNSWVVVNSNGEKKIKIDAMIELWNHSPILKYFSFVLEIPPIYFVLTKTYEWVANHRTQMGILTSWFEIRDKFTFRSFRIFTILMAILYFACCFQWNTRKLNYKLSGRRVFDLMGVTRELQLFQEWDMFSPFPLTNTRWFYIDGETASGKILNFSPGKDVSLGKKPKQHLSNAYSSKYWRKFFNNMENKKLNRELYMDYLCKKKLGKSERLKKVSIYIHDMQTKYPPKKIKPFNHKLLASKACY